MLIGCDLLRQLVAQVKNIHTYIKSQQEMNTESKYKVYTSNDTQNYYTHTHLTALCPGLPG